MVLRIGFDLDGVLADFVSAFIDVETRLFGPASSVPAESPETEASRQEKASSEGEVQVPPHDRRRRRDAVWAAIEETPDFWTTVKPLDPAAVPRIHEMMLRHGWEVFFITQRPATAGQTVQRQTQRWLHEQGFEMPSVLVISGSRGAAAGALRLDCHVDDSWQHCLDVSVDSRARPILIVPESDEATSRSAHSLNITVARSIAEALDLLETISTDAASTTLLGRLSRIWKR